MSQVSTAQRAEAPALGAMSLGAVIGGTVAGLIDIFAAALINQAPPGLILRFIASGLLGKAALHGGAGTIVLGLVLQIAMALLIAAIYGTASLRLPVLIRRPVSFGALFGVGVFVVMTFVVVPLSAAPHPKHLPTLSDIAPNLAAMVLFGLIVANAQAWAARRRA